MKALAQQYFYLGRVRLSSLYKGELKVTLPFAWPVSLPAPPYVYFYQHHTYVPYKVEGCRVSGHILFLMLPHLDLLEQQRREGKGYDLFVLWDWLCDRLKGSPSVADLVFCRGFKVVDRVCGDIGMVAGVQERTLQPLLVVDGEQDAFEIPMHEKFIHHIDFEGRCVEVSWSPNA